MKCLFKLDNANVLAVSKLQSKPLTVGKVMLNRFEKLSYQVHRALLFMNVMKVV